MKTVDSGAGWCLQHEGWELQAPTGHRVFLSAGERLLMQALSAQPGVALSRPALSAAIAAVHHSSAGRLYGDRRVDMLISRLRTKARQTGSELPLDSVPRKGYVLGIVHTV